MAKSMKKIDSRFPQSAGSDDDLDAVADIGQDYVEFCSDVIKEVEKNISNPNTAVDRSAVISVDIPLLLNDSGNTDYVSRRIDLTLSGDEGVFWQRLLVSARKNHLTFNGRRPDEHVETSADLVRYLVQGLMRSAEKW